jgi:DNA-binding response OmpR family regulator
VLRHHNEHQHAEVTLVVEEGITPSVLVAEDDPDLRAAMKLIFERAGYRVLIAPDGVATLDMVGQWHPDLIVLDVRMPGASGLDVCRTLRADPAVATVPILIVSASVLTGDVKAGTEAGADAYLAKPFSNNELLTNATALLSRLSAGHEVDFRPCT